MRDLPFLMDDDHLKVKNNNQNVVTFRWARKFYSIEPGGEMFVIFQALVDALGDPRSMDNKVVTFNDGQGNRGICLQRYDELSRLFARYAVKEENIDELVAKAPKVHVETLTGQKVSFPCQRPDMLPYPVPMVDDRAVNSDTTRMIDTVAAENAELRERLDRLEQAATQPRSNGARVPPESEVCRACPPPPLGAPAGSRCEVPGGQLPAHRPDLVLLLPLPL